MEEHNFSPENKASIEECLNFLLARAKGEIKTGARLIREMVLSHPEYK
jgi:hypothetical protein